MAVNSCIKDSLFLLTSGSASRFRLDYKVALNEEHQECIMELLRTREQCIARNSTPLACVDLHNETVRSILAKLVPSCRNNSNWEPVGEPWVAFFYLHIVIFVLLFLLVGVACALFLYKHRLTARFAKAQTFVAIDVSLVILGFSRVLFYLLDPFGLSGFCNHFACVVISRLLASLAFPSLTASYTLVFLTLWQSARVRLGRTCVQDLRIIIPFTLIHYFAAVITEIVGFVSPYPLVFMLISCELVFALWGMIVCVTFLVGGIRLLRSVHSSARQSSLYCRSSVDQTPPSTHSQRSRPSISRKAQTQLQQHHKQAVRKVSSITYSAAVLGVFYSLINIVSTGLVTNQIFSSCPYNSRDNPRLWLGLMYVRSFLEFAMAALLIYAVNDIRPLVKASRDLIQTVFFRNLSTTTSEQKSTISSTRQADTSKEVLDSSGSDSSVKKDLKPKASSGQEQEGSPPPNGTLPADIENGRVAVEEKVLHEV